MAGWGATMLTVLLAPKSQPTGYWRMLLEPGESRSLPAMLYGHIEIGEQQGFGFIVRALDYDGMVFEDNRVHTVAEARSGLAGSSHAPTSSSSVGKRFQDRSSVSEQLVKYPARRALHSGRGF